MYGANSATTPEPDSSAWFPLLPDTRLQPDTRHYFDVDTTEEVTHVRLDVFPDGGISRLRVVGSVDAAARRSLALRWFNSLPAEQARTVLTSAGTPVDAAAELTARRPLNENDPALGEIPALFGE